ncbi:MAG: hypothetical protein WBH31_13205 [Promethearchaeia archaeon]
MTKGILQRNSYGFFRESVPIFLGGGTTGEGDCHRKSFHIWQFVYYSN